MHLLAADPIVTVPPVTAVVYTLDGVTTVLVAFLFACLAMPHLVKNRPQWYMALASLVGVILLHVLSLMFSTSPSAITFFAVGTGVLQLLALILLVFCVGGLTAKELAGDMARAYEVMRRGETQKETIIPIGDQSAAPRRGRAEPQQKVYRVDDDDADGTALPLS